MILLPKHYIGIKSTLKMGNGLFAKQHIAKGKVIGDYIGKILHPAEAIVDEENIYLMYYHDRAVISPDLKTLGVHLLNHSCKPNSWLYVFRGHTLAFTLRDILAGEELTIPYLLAPKTELCNPCSHICKCGNLDCTGTMHLSEEKYKKWSKFNEINSKKTKRERISYGKYLPCLSSYPEKISPDYIYGIEIIFGHNT